MAGAALAFDVLARDKATGTLAKVGKEVDGTAGKFGKFNAKIAAGAAVAGAAMVKFASDSIAAFKESELSAAALDSALAKNIKTNDVTRASFDDLNGALARKVKYDDDALASGQAVLAGFNLTGKQIQSLTPLLADYASKTGSDLPSAAQVLGKAVLGNGKALKGVGIQFKDTGSAAGNFAQLQEKLSAKVGGFAENEGKTAAGQAAILGNQFGELQETLGSKLMPVMLKVTSIGLKMVDFISKNSSVILPLVGALGTLVVGIKLVTAAQTAWNVAMALNPVGAVIMGLVALGVGLTIAWKKSETFRGVVIGAFQKVSLSVLGIVEGLLKGVRFFATVSDKVFGTNFTPTIDGAIAKVNALQAKIEGLDDKRITIDAVVNFKKNNPKALVTDRGELATIERFAGATGAIVTRPTRALIGEAGPEAVVPLSQAPGARPLAASQLSRPTVVNNHYTITVQGSVQTERDLVDSIARGLADRRYRGGPE